MKTFKKVLAVVMCCALMLAIAAPFASAATRPTLKFDSNGNFRVLFITDCHTNDQPYDELIKFIGAALDEYDPDLVVFGGDNVRGNWKWQTTSAVQSAIDQLVKPLVVRNVPFAVIYGNHDWQTTAPKTQQTSFYKSYSQCLMKSGFETIDRTGNYNLQVKNSAGTKNIFNMWFVDSGTKNSITGDYDAVNDAQIEWYNDTCKDLKKANGGVVMPSILFQHIPIPQVRKVFDGDVKTPEKDYGEYDAWVKNGDVVAAFFGHDHKNDYCGVTDEGIMLAATKCAGFQSAGDVRGMRVIDVNEDAVVSGDRDNMIDTFNIYYSDFFDDEATIKTKKDYDTSDRLKDEGSYIGDFFKRLWKAILKIITFGLYEG